MSKPRPKKRLKNVAITRALAGTTLYLQRAPEPIILSEDDIPTIVAALRASGLRVTRIKGRKKS